VDQHLGVKRVVGEVQLGQLGEEGDLLREGGEVGGDEGDEGNLGRVLERVRNREGEVVGLDLQGLGKVRL